MEQWVDIKGYEGWYQISSYGNVRSLDRVSSDGRLYKGKERAKCFDRRGYCVLVLCKEGKQKTHKFHRLVAEHFIPNPRAKETVNHIDGNKENNNVDNLEWCTQSENQKHAFATGLQETYKGDKHVKAKLTNNQAFSIRMLRAGNPNLYTLETLANMYSVSVTTISLIVNHKRYKEGKLC